MDAPLAKISDGHTVTRAQCGYGRLPDPKPPRRVGPPLWSFYPTQRERLGDRVFYHTTGLMLYYRGRSRRRLGMAGAHAAAHRDIATVRHPVCRGAIPTAQEGSSTPRPRIASARRRTCRAVLDASPAP